ncbi:MAG: DUF6622 family protein [Hyphomicrobiales bacterium]
MISSIIDGTPVWVWVLFVVLVSRGIKMLRTRQTTIERQALMPVIFSIWSLWSIATELSALEFGFGGFLVGAAAGFGSGFGLYSAIGYRTSYSKASGLLECPGSIMPLIMILTAFCLKYGISVFLALHQDSAHSNAFCFLYGAIGGVVSGMFWGRSFFLLWPWRRELARS